MVTVVLADQGRKRSQGTLDANERHAKGNEDHFVSLAAAELKMRGGADITAAYGVHGGDADACFRDGVPLLRGKMPGENATVLLR